MFNMLCKHILENIDFYVVKLNTKKCHNEVIVVLGYSYGVIYNVEIVERYKIYIVLGIT